MKNIFFLILRGFAMGTADLIPGVSGGTIAFITGIYEELINSIKSFDLVALKLLFNGQIKGFWNHINGLFLVPLFSGIALAVFSLSRVIPWLLNFYEIYVWSFFFGLIIIASIMILKTVEKWPAITIISLIVGTALGYLLTIITKTATPETTWFVFICGTIAVSAMLLPGISGSFLLVVLGKYVYIFSALKELQIEIIAAFGVGMVFGLLTFSRIAAYFFKKYKNQMIAAMSGFMIGSLNKVWPWKETIAWYTDRHGVKKPLVQENVMFESFNKEVIIALTWMLAGVFIVIAIEKAAKQFSKS